MEYYLFYQMYINIGIGGTLSSITTLHWVWDAMRRGLSSRSSERRFTFFNQIRNIS